MQYNSPCQWLCANVLCAQFGCQRAKTGSSCPKPMGCICPPTSKKTPPLHDMEVLLPPANIEGDYLSGWVEGQSYLILNYGTDEAFEAATKTCDIIETLKSRIEALEAALHFYADWHQQPSDGPWGVDSKDFGDVARKALESQP